MLSILIAVVAAGLAYSIYRLVRGPRPKVRGFLKKNYNSPVLQKIPTRKLSILQAYRKKLLS
jgi:hypothetical protein